MSAVYVMWHRQLIRYWRSRGRMLGSLGQPLLFLIALGFGLGPIFQRAGQGNFIDFLVPGVIAMSILFTSMFAGMEVIWDRQFGFLKETLVAPVKRSRIMLGKTLGGATVATAQGVIVFIIALIVGFHPASALGLITALIFMFLIAFLFSAFGVALSSKLEDMQAFPIIMNFLIMPIFFLSGALFPLDSVPQFLKTIAIFDPLSYGVDGLRGALSGTAHFSFLTSFSVLIVISLIVLFIGSHLFSKIEA